MIYNQCFRGLKQWKLRTHVFVMDFSAHHILYEYLLSSQHFSFRSFQISQNATKVFLLTETHLFLLIIAPHVFISNTFICIMWAEPGWAPATELSVYKCSVCDREEPESNKKRRVSSNQDWVWFKGSHDLEAAEEAAANIYFNVSVVVLVRCSLWNSCSSWYSPTSWRQWDIHWH